MIFSLLDMYKVALPVDRLFVMCYFEAGVIRFFFNICEQKKNYGVSHGITIR